MKNMMQMEEVEEEEATLEFSENYPSYYVQSPISISHVNYNTITETQLNRENHNHEPLLLLTMPNYHHSPLYEHHHQSFSFSPTKPLLNQDNNMSRCSSSRASTTSFVHDNKINNNVLLPNKVVDCSKNNHVTFAPATTSTTVALKKMGRFDGEEEEEEEYDENDVGKSSCLQYLSFNTYPSSYVWIGLQLLWRFLFSVMLALLVFYIVTKPPPPHVSLKVERVNQFELTEGVDLTGVATTLLSCNVSIGLIIDNKSKVFGLHVMSPVVNVYFGRVPFILSQGQRMYVESREWREMDVYIGTNKKAMYGGGRNMKDMLNSGQGLPLLVTLTFSSYFRVVANLIQSHFHHQAHCFLVLQHLHDNKNHHTTTTTPYNSTCRAT